MGRLPRRNLGIIGAILCMFFIDNRLVGKLFSFVFPLDKLEYGWYITCGVYVKNKVGRTFTPGKPAKKEEFNCKYMMESYLYGMAPIPPGMPLTNSFPVCTKI